MKVSEIILEAPQQTAQIPNFGTAGQQYNVNYNLNTGKGGASKGGTTAPKITAGPNGMMFNVNGKPTPFSPKDVLAKVSAKGATAAKGLSSALWKKFTGTPVGRFVTSKYTGPLLLWVDDMSSINELWNAGMFNDHGDKAGEVAQQLRTYYTQLAFTRMGTMWVAWGAASFATGMAVKGLVALIPGLGWLANIAAFLAQAAVYALLNSEDVQKFLTFKLMENLAPEWINDPVYGIARTLGGAGVAVPAYITQLKKKYLGSDKKDADKEKPAKSTSSSKAAPADAEPSDGISGAELAKQL